MNWGSAFALSVSEDFSAIIPRDILGALPRPYLKPILILSIGFLFDKNKQKSNIENRFLEI
jgi:hypothetical protein